MNETPQINQPFISVVIPIRNEERFIGRTLDYILTQDYPKDKFEILVVDGCSDDNTRNVVEKKIAEDSRIQLFNNPKCLSSSARNIGAKAAKGEIITYIDGHVYLDNDQILKNIASLMAEKDVCVLSRPQFLDTPDNSFFQKAVSLARRSPFGHGLDSTIYLARDKFVNPTSSGACYKREVFEKAGYFDENFDAAEDLEFNYRVGKAGYKAFTSIKLAVYYYPRENLKGLFNQLMRYGLGRRRFLIKHRTGWASGAILLALFSMYLIELALLSLFSTFWLKVLIGSIGFYLFMNLLSSLIVALKNDIKFLPLLPIIYLTIHGGLARGFFKDILKKSDK